MNDDFEPIEYDEFDPGPQLVDVPPGNFLFGSTVNRTPPSCPRCGLAFIGPKAGRRWVLHEC